MSIKKIPVGISSCLLGEEVRYDGGHKLHSYISQTLGQYFEFRPFCPEMSIGLGVPRETIRLIERDGQTRCVNSKRPEIDVTERLIACAGQQDWHAHICGYIVKKDSPSCGMERVRLYRTEQPLRKGVGLYTQEMMRRYPFLPIEEEGRLGDPLLRQNFIQRVFILQRWRDLISEGATRAKVTQFHARHKLVLMSHNQAAYRRLGKKVAAISEMPLSQFCDTYLLELMQLLKKPASRKNHVNVLQHIQGYLKRDLDGEDRQELAQVIDQYRVGLLPLIVPITLLRHHFRRHPNAYIADSYYMSPHPDELMLLNQL